MKKTTVFRWWWGWNYEEIENWLEKMALDGYKLTEVTSIGVLFSFEKTEIKKIRYCIDYQQIINPNYIEIIGDDGWDTIKMGSGWYVCSKEYDGERPQLYTDFDSLLSRNNKLMFVIVTCGLPFFLFSPVALLIIDVSVVKLVIAILWFLILMFDIFVIISLRKTNKAILKKKELKNQ